MYCDNCGKEIEDNGAFCPECGMQIKAVQSKGSKENLIRRRGKKKVVILFILFICILAGAYVLFKVVEDKQYKNSMDMGKQYLKEDQYEEAINSFEEAIKYTDMEVEPYWNKAKTYTEMGDVDQAGQAYSQVIEVLINKTVHEGEIPEDTEEICKEVMAFWGNLDTMQKDEKLVEIESMLSKIDPYIDDSIREELYLEKVIYEHNGMASAQLKGTYISETKKSYGHASTATTQYAIGESCKTGVVFYEKGDFDSDGKKDMVIVYSDIDEQGRLVLTLSVYSSVQNTYLYSLADIKSANFHFFVKNNYFVMVEQEEVSSGFYSGVYYPVLSKMEEYQKSIDNHFNEKICVINLGEEFKTVCEFERVIDDSSSDNHTSTSTLNIDDGKNKNGFSKGYASYGWPSDTEVVLDEEEMNRKVLSILSSYKIDNINLQNITWDNRKTALAVETNSSIDNITKILFTSSEGTLDESDENNVKIAGTFTMDIVNTRNVSRKVSANYESDIPGTLNDENEEIVDEAYFDTMDDTEINVEGSGQNLNVHMTIDHLADFVKYNGGNIKLQLSDGNIALMFKYTIEDDVAATDEYVHILTQNNGNISWMGAGWHEINCEQNEDILSWNITLPSGSFTTENIKYIGAAVYTSRSRLHVSTYEMQKGELLPIDASIEQMDVAVNSGEGYHKYIE